MQVLMKIYSIIFASVLCISATAQFNVTVEIQHPDSLTVNYNWEKTTERNCFPVKGMIIPAAMITYGVISLNNASLQNINENVQQSLWVNKPHQQLHLDTYLMLVPAATAFGLEAFGVKGNYCLRDKAMIYLMSNIFANAAVYPLKKGTHQLRPDGSNYFSFPSGHTTQAFAAAEFLRKEYKNVSIWYGIAGYTVAAATGYLRMYNNKHWFGDIVAGAGIGMASTKLSYWLYPKIKHWFFKDKLATTTFLPTYSNGSFGIGMVHAF